jgi:hypothetical protein
MRQPLFFISKNGKYFERIICKSIINYIDLFFCVFHTKGNYIYKMQIGFVI